MRSAIFLFAIGLVPMLGLWVCALPVVAALDRVGRWAVSAVAGFVELTLLFFVLSIFGVKWSLLFVAVLAVASVLIARRGLNFRASPPSAGRARLSLLVIAVALVLTAYAAATTRATSADLLFFWGTKGERFAIFRGIDTAFLATPENVLLHPDYPPLLPVTYAVGAMAAGHFPWRASLLELPFFLSLSAATFWGWARPVLGDRIAARSTAMLTSVLGYLFVFTMCAGNAEAPLIFFECAALTPAIFAVPGRQRDLCVSLALTGAVLTKVEGAAFAALFVVAAPIFDAASGRWWRAIRIAVLPAFSSLSWLAFCFSSHLLDAYVSKTVGRFSLAHLRAVLKGVPANLGYGIWYLPWVLLAIWWFAGDRPRDGRFPAFLGIFLGIVNAVFYLHGALDPSPWIGWSASRTYLTPMVCLFFAGAASQVRVPSPVAI